MENKGTFLFDTYALIEILNGNMNYDPYIGKKMVINNLIYSEFAYKLFRENVGGVENYLSEIEQAILPISVEVIKKAMRFRVKNKKKKMSMVDCISYFMAKELGVKFLTGDKEFEDLDFVEFVK